MLTQLQFQVLDDGRGVGNVETLADAKREIEQTRREIYELKNEAKKAPKKQSRDNVAALSSSQTQGEPTIEAEKDKNFNPSWGAIADAARKKITG